MGNTAFILVIHGSRYPGTVEQMSALVDKLRALRPAARVVGAYLEILSPGVPETIDALAGEGVGEIVLLPYFALDGRHSREDLPRLAAEGATRHPGLVVRAAPPIGVRGEVLALLLAGAER